METGQRRRADHRNAGHRGDLSRARQLTEEDLQGEGAMICFGGADDEGWYFVNGHFIGESHDWQAQPIFDAKKYLRAGTTSSRGRLQQCRPRRLESERECADHRPCDRRAVVAQPVQRPGASHRAVHARRRRNQIDGNRR